MRKRTWCAAHYAMWKRIGEVKPFTYAQAERLADCLVCGRPTVKELRRFCSGKCDRNYRKWGGIPPLSKPCSVCGAEFSLVLPNGIRRSSKTGLCRRCRRHSRKHGMSVVQLAQRDGTDCGICREPVDLDAAVDDPMRPSVDHIFPRARGGSNDPSNLQLAHLRCNNHKRDKVLT